MFIDIHDTIVLCIGVGIATFCVGYLIGFVARGRFKRKPLDVFLTPTVEAKQSDKP